MPLSICRKYQPYFSRSQVNLLTDANKGKLSLSRVEALRQLACGYIDNVGVQIGFPRKTIATAQVLYYRFHLFVPMSEFNYQDVAVASLLVACKLQDTIKKLRDIQIASHKVRAFLDGAVLHNEPDSHILEQERLKTITIERLILETISFNFNTAAGISDRDVFGYLRRIGHRLKAPKRFMKIAFRVAIDVHRTVAPLVYPSHVISLACLYLASFLDPSHPNSSPNSSSSSLNPTTTTTTTSISTVDPQSNGHSPPYVQFPPGWESDYSASIGDIEDVCHLVLDLFTSAGIPGPSPSSSSPAEPLVNYYSSNNSTIAFDFTQIKIRLRNIQGERSTLSPQDDTSLDDPSSTKRPRLEDTDTRSDLLGRDDVTVRFLFGPTKP